MLFVGIVNTKSGIVKAIIEINYNVHQPALPEKAQFGVEQRGVDDGQSVDEKRGHGNGVQCGWKRNRIGIKCQKF